MSIENKKYIYRPVAVPPGETLLEILEFFNMSQKELAERMGRPLKLVNEIVKGKTSITPETSIQLERVLGKEAAFWTNLEAGYQEALARLESEKSLEEEVKKAKEYPYQEMVKNGWIANASNIIDKTRNLLEYFGVNSLDNVVETRLIEPVLYKISTKKKVDSYAISAWLRKGVIDAQEIETKHFDEGILKENIPNIKKLINDKPEEFLEKIKIYLADAGIAFVVNKNLTNVPVNGASKWLRSDKALIQLSIYGKSADKFWFALFHEIGHMLLHGKKDFNISITNSPDVSIKEAEANEYAKNVLIPPDEYNKFLSKGEFDALSVSSFAAKVKVTSGIVVGRLQFERHIGYNKLNQLKGSYVWKD